MNEYPTSTVSEQGRVSTPFKDGRQVASELIAHWPSDMPFEVSAVLRDTPELQDHKSAIIVLAYEEFCRRAEAGQEISATDFANRFPAVQQSLLRRLAVQQWLEEHLSLLGDLSPIPWPEEKEAIVGFELIEELGRGAFSRVFLAEETEVGGRLVVVKVCLSGSREAEALGKLQHPHIVPIHSVRIDDATGLVVICMPFQGRVTLFDVMDYAFAGGKTPTYSRKIEEAVKSLDFIAGPLDEANAGKSLFRRGPYVNAAIRIGLQLAEALEFTHGCGFCHCDIKPSNVLITSAGIAKLLDFNLSFRVQSDTTNIGGTVPYMAPEQLQAMLNRNDDSPSEIDQRADVFAFGVVMYELLCGKLPFGELDPQLPSKQIAETLLKRQRNGPRPLQELNAQVNDRLAGVIERCLAFDAVQRPQTAGEIARALRLLLTPTARSQRWLQSHRRSWVSALVMSLVVFSAMAFHVATRDPYSVRQLRSGWEAYQKNQFEQAIEHFDRSLHSDPNGVDALFGRGRAYYCEKEYEKALADFEAVKVHVQDGCVEAGIADCLISLARERKDPQAYRSAILFYQRAIEQGFASAAVHNNIGFCFFASRDFDSAERHLFEAIKQNKQLPTAYYNLASVDRQKSAQAGGLPNLQYIEQAVKLRPHNAEFHLLAASIYALSAQRSPQRLEGDAKPLLEHALMHSKKAVALGINPTKLEIVASSFPPICQESRFTSLQKSPPPTITPDELVRIVDSLAHLDESIGLGVQ